MGLFNFGKKTRHSHGEEPHAKIDDNSMLTEEKKDMIKGVEELSETSVKEVMIPRIDVDFISIDTPQEELLEKVAASGHSRFPVYSESIDNVEGVLYVKDIIKAYSRKEGVDLRGIIRKAYFVPESKRIDSLLREFKRRKIHIAIAIDEYGGVSGIVCMEAIIEEIVGDIQDEFDNENELVVSTGKNAWICDARVNLEELNETISSDFPTEDLDTLGGFVLDLFGRIPSVSERAEFGDFEFTVQKMEGHRINLLKVIKKTEAKTDDN